ncbi:hypothetical protein AMTRI_Chr02g258600 [Amborella trichopoda]
MGIIYRIIAKYSKQIPENIIHCFSSLYSQCLKQWKIIVTENEFTYLKQEVRRSKHCTPFLLGDETIDSKWVVRYNPNLLLKYNCHINVEMCSTIKFTNHIYIYIYKGHDKIKIIIAPKNENTTIDEIKEFRNARWAKNCFFVDEPGGTVQTLLYRALLAFIHKKRNIALATVSSGIAATNLPGGTTAQTRFKIPLNPKNNSICSISKLSETATLFRELVTIIWDEAPMISKYAFECLNRSLQDIMSNNNLFGGKLDGIEKTYDKEFVRLPNEIAFNFTREIFRDFSAVMDTCILAKKNDIVHEVNDIVISNFSKEEQIYYSFDSAIDDKYSLSSKEYINSLKPSGLPPHILRLKKSVPIVLLRNLNPKHGMYNGTKLIWKSFQRNLIEAKIPSGSHAGNIVFIPRIPLQPSEDIISLPISFKRKQFPVHLAFAMTINKSQGHTIQNVGIYLPDDVFSHRQLYVVLS